MLKEVYFNIYCEGCVYKNLSEEAYPCDQCLAIPAREDSHRPEYYKEEEK